jgi:hypothetical protein
MTIRNTGGPKIIDPRRLAAHADMRADADGLATKKEVAAQTGAVVKPTKGSETNTIHPVDVRKSDLHQVLGKLDDVGIETLDPTIRALPAPIRRLALEIDGLWGVPDGKISVDELERVAKYYLAALPFYTKEAGALLELAQHLGFADDMKPAPAAKNVLSLRMAMAKVDKDEVARGENFRALLDEAIAESDVPGLPGLLRDAEAHNPKWHRLSILEHTAVAVTAIRDLASSVGIDWKDAGAVMLLHDIGKVLERNIVKDPDGVDRYAFWGHEGLGAKWLESKGLSGDLVFHVNHHADLRGTSVDDMKTLCGTKERLAQAIVVYVADQVAKGDTPDQLKSFEKEWPKIATLCQHAGLDASALAATRDALITKWFKDHPT